MSGSIGAHAFEAAASATTFVASSFTSTGGSGAVMVVDVSWYGSASAPTVTDSKGNTYTQQQATVAYATDANFKAARFICERFTGGAGHTITATFGSAVFGGISHVEVLGCITVGTITDQAPVGNSAAHNDTTPYLSTTTGTTAQADEVVVACAATYTNSGTESHTWNNGYTALDGLTDPSVWTGATSWKLLTATGTQQSSLTSSGGATDDAVTFITTFKTASGGGGGTNTPMTISVTQTQTPSRARGIGAPKSATQTQTPSRLRGVGAPKSATQTQTPSRIRALAPIAKAVTAVQTLARALGIGKPISVTQVQVTGGVPVQTGVGLTLSATQTQTATRTRLFGLLKAATQTQTPVQSRLLPLTKSVTQTQTPSRIRGVGKPISATQAQTPSLASRALTRALLVVATQVLTVTRALARALSVTETQTPTAGVAQSGGGAHFMTLSATVTQTVSLVRAIGRSVTTTQTQTPTRLRLVARTPITVTQTQTPSITKGQGFFKTLTATVVQTPARVRSLGLARAVTQVQALVMGRLIGKPVSATQTQTPTRIRALPRAIATTTTQTPSVTKGQGFFKTLTATVTQTASRTRELGLARSATQMQIGTVARALGLVRSVVQLQVLSSIRNVARSLLGLSTQTPSQQHGQAHFLTLSTTQVQSPTAELEQHDGGPVFVPAGPERTADALPRHRTALAMPDQRIVFLKTPKDPQSEEDFNWGCAALLKVGDTVAVVTKIFVARGDSSLVLLTAPAISDDGQTVGARLGGGRLGVRYRVTIRFTTATGEKLDMSIEFDCLAA